EIMADKSGRIGLFVDQGDRGAGIEQATVGLVAPSEIGCDELRGNERANYLCVAGPDQLGFARRDEIAEAPYPCRIPLLDFFQRVAGDLDPDRPMRRGKGKQGPITALDNAGPVAFLDGRKSQIEMEQRKEVQRRRLRSGCGRRGTPAGECAHYRVSISMAASPARAAAKASPWECPVASTMAPEGRLSPAGGITSPGLAVTIISAMPGRRFAASAPRTSMTRTGFGKA